jgi:hypothetical protein
MKLMWQSSYAFAGSELFLVEGIFRAVTPPVTTIILSPAVLWN